MKKAVVETPEIKVTNSPQSIHYMGKPINKTAVNKDSIEAITPETDRMVSGTFVNVECPGQPAKVCCKLYRGMQYFSQTFEDGQAYTIPLSVARFINERIYHERHTHILDETGNPIKDPKKIPRYKFTANF